MPAKGQLPEGPHRQFVEELFMHYREAGRPTLRAIADWIDQHQDSHDLRGTASTETIRRVLNSAVVPRSWLTVQTILQALCGLADRSTSEDRWPEDNWSNRTFADELKMRWNAVIDDEDGNMPELPPRPQPPIAPTAYASGSDDPWGSPAVTSSSLADEAPF